MLCLNTESSFKSSESSLYSKIEKFSQQTRACQVDHAATALLIVSFLFARFGVLSVQGSQDKVSARVS